MKIKTKLLLNFLLIAIIILIAGVLGIIQTNLLYSVSRDVGIKNGPLADASMEIKLTATTAHLWFEEIITGAEEKEIIEKVWLLLDESIWYVDAMFYGGQNAEGIFYPVDDQLIEAKLLNIKASIEEFIRMAQLRFNNNFGQKKLQDQVLDDKFDKLFDKFIIETDEVEEILHSKMAQDAEIMLTTAKTSKIILIVATILGFLIAIIAAFYITHNIMEQIGDEPAKIAIITKQVAAGDLNIKFKTGVTTGIYADIQIMVQNFNNVIADIVQISQGFADGKLNIVSQAKYKGDFTQIKNSLENASSNLQLVIKDIVQVSQGLADGSKNVVAKADYQGDFIQIKTALEAAANKLSEAMEQNTIQNWLKTGQTELSKKISGEQEVIDLAKNICNFLTTYLEAQIGAFYVVEEEIKIKLIASYAYNQRKGLPSEFQLGEGLVGQAVLEKQKILVTDVPKDYISIQSGIGEAVPRNILVMPFMYENSVKGAIELGSFHEFTPTQLELLEQVMPNIGITMNTAESRTKMQALLQGGNNS